MGYTELRAYLAYALDDRPLTFWRVRSGQEVDFPIGDESAIEVEATTNVSGRHLGGLKALAEEVRLKSRIVVSRDPAARLQEGVRVLPVREFLKELWTGRF